MLNKHLIPLNNLLGDSISSYWKGRIANSICTVELIFDIHLEPGEITRDSVEPNLVWVAATDELDGPHALECIDVYGASPPPCTIIFYHSTHYLFMGAVRALMYAFSNQKIDAIIVDVSRSNKVAFPVKDAKITVEDYLQQFLGSG